MSELRVQRRSKQATLVPLSCSFSASHFMTVFKFFLLPFHLEVIPHSYTALWFMSNASNCWKHLFSWLLIYVSWRKCLCCWPSRVKKKPWITLPGRNVQMIAQQYFSSFSVYSQRVSNLGLEHRVCIKQSFFFFFGVKSSAVQLYCDTVIIIYRVSKQSITVL